MKIKLVESIATKIPYMILSLIFLPMIGCWNSPYEKAMSSYEPIEVLHALETIYDVNQLLSISRRCKQISNSMKFENTKVQQIDAAELMTKKAKWFGLHLTAIQRVGALTKGVAISDLERNDFKFIRPAKATENPFM